MMMCIHANSNYNLLCSELSTENFDEMRVENRTDQNPLPSTRVLATSG